MGKIVHGKKKSRDYTKVETKMAESPAEGKQTAHWENTAKTEIRQLMCSVINCIKLCT